MFGTKVQNIFLKNLMLNYKNNANDAVYDEYCKKKKKKSKIKISKNEGYFFRQHPLVEKSSTATDVE